MKCRVVIVIKAAPYTLDDDFDQVLRQFHVTLGGRNFVTDELDESRVQVCFTMEGLSARDADRMASRLRALVKKHPRLDLRGDAVLQPRH